MRALTPNESDALLSGAVAVKRTKFPRDPLDFYTEERWPSERLFDVERFEGTIYDPAAGNGHILQSAARAGFKVIGTDIVAREGSTSASRDFIARPMPADNVVCNPPFKHCVEVSAAARAAGSFDFAWIKVALTTARRKVALFLPTEFLNGAKRQAFLATTPLYRVYYLSPRPKIWPGAEPPLKGGGFVDFVWVVWLRGFDGPWTGHFLSKGAKQNGQADTRGSP